MEEKDLFTSVSDSMRLVSCGISVETASFYCIRNSRGMGANRYTVPQLVTDKMVYEFMKNDVFIVVPRWCIQDLVMLGAEFTHKGSFNTDIADMVNQIVKRNTGP